jgi:hypothetical protein
MENSFTTMKENSSSHINQLDMAMASQSYRIPIPTDLQIPDRKCCAYDSLCTIFVRPYDLLDNSAASF